MREPGEWAGFLFFAPDFGQKTAGKGIWPAMEIGKNHTNFPVLSRGKRKNLGFDIPRKTCYKC